MADKSSFRPQLTEAEIDALVDNTTPKRPGVFNKTVILLGLAGYKVIMTNSVLRASLVI